MLAKIDNHLHLPIQTPDAESLARLKREDPQAHKMWLRQVEKQLEHERFMESANYRLPLSVMKSAQRNGLLALAFLTALAAYMAYLDQPWLAGLFGVFDVVAIVALFTGYGQGSVDDDDAAGGQPS